MNTTYTGPWRELDRLQRELNEVFGRSGMPRSAREFPPMNIWTNDDGAVVTAEVPGLDPSQIDISVLGDTLTVKGERVQPTTQDGRTFHRRERNFGPFIRTVQVAFRIESAKVTARYDRGLLEITAPRADRDRSRSITVTTG